MATAKKSAILKGSANLFNSTGIEPQCRAPRTDVRTYEYPGPTWLATDREVRMAYPEPYQMKGDYSPLMSEEGIVCWVCGGDGAKHCCPECDGTGVNPKRPGPPMPMGRKAIKFTKKRGS